MFDIDMAGKVGNELLGWIKSASSDSVSYPNPLDLSRIQIIRPIHDFSFADKGSRCLNISSLICYSGPAIFAHTNEGALDSPSAFVFLEQVRRHSRTPYLLLLSYANCKVCDGMRVPLLRLFSVLECLSNM